MHDPKVVERHPHRPVAARILEAAEAGNEDADAQSIGRRRVEDRGDAGAFVGDVRGEGRGRSAGATEAEEDAGDEEFGERKAGAGRRKAGFGVHLHSASIATDLQNASEGEGRTDTMGPDGCPHTTTDGA